MRKKLSLCLYMLLVEAIAVYLVVFPVYAFQVSSSTTGYVRVASQAAVSAYQTAKLPTQAAAIASAVAAAPSGASVALRVVAGASWPALGVLVGLTLLQIYLDSNKTAAIKAAAATPGAVDGAWRDRVDHGGAPRCHVCLCHLWRRTGVEWLFLDDRESTDRTRLLCQPADRPHGSPLHGRTVLCAGKTNQ